MGTKWPVSKSNRSCPIFIARVFEGVRDQRTLKSIELDGHVYRLN